MMVSEALEMLMLSPEGAPSKVATSPLKSGWWPKMCIREKLKNNRNFKELGLAGDRKDSEIGFL